MKGLLAGPLAAALGGCRSGAPRGGSLGGPVGGGALPPASSWRRAQPGPGRPTFTVLGGAFRILHAAPDGDSIRFYPHAAGDWAPLGEVRANREGGAQVRLEGVDALETHYDPPGRGLGTLHQPLDLGRGAADRLLRLLGFRAVVRAGRETVVRAEPAEVPGHILCRQVDRYGRVVAFVFPGPAPVASGARVALDPPALRPSANFILLREGWVYPTFYAPLPAPLREELRQAARRARAEGRGVWPRDRTTRGFTLTHLSDLATHGYLLPKLYRRVVDHLASQGGAVSLDGFSATLADRGDRLRLAGGLGPQAHTDLGALIEVRGQTFRLTRAPEDLVFQE